MLWPFKNRNPLPIEGQCQGKLCHVWMDAMLMQCPLGLFLKWGPSNLTNLITSLPFADKCPLSKTQDTRTLRMRDWRTWINEREGEYWFSLPSLLENKRVFAELKSSNRVNSTHSQIVKDFVTSCVVWMRFKTMQHNQACLRFQLTVNIQTSNKSELSYDAAALPLHRLTLGNTWIPKPISMSHT